MAEGPQGASGQPAGLGRAVLVGLVGRGIGLSRTPRMHEVEGARLGLRHVYRLLDTDRMGATPPPLAEILRAAEICGFAGLNVTHPYKKEVLALLDELSDNARAIGAANTVVFRDGRRFGHNTDMWGFAESFRRGMEGAPRARVLLLGAGGAGCAVAHALLDCGVERLLIRDAHAPAAEALAEALAARYGAARVGVLAELGASLEGIDGIVNATPIGMADHPGLPLPAELLDPRLWVADIVYFPLETELLGTARAKGCRTLAGSGMALFQAVRAFELFTGLAPDSEAMRATFESFGT
ncbi:MAG TPA: shikimate dehydrogenase [Paracoccaceae bacterium]|nr:shikimate dehydrogenase [Paracoccaceae bacterium]